jgi:hypothetical protein
MIKRVEDTTDHGKKAGKPMTHTFMREHVTEMTKGLLIDAFDYAYGLGVVRAGSKIMTQRKVRSYSSE